MGVGLEELGVDEFVKGNFFNGELYIDAKKECYKTIGYKRLGFFSALGSVFGKKGRDMISDAKSKGIGGDLKGDGYQNGGTLVVSAGGKEVLLDFRQDSPADHVEPSEILKVLNIKGDTTEKPSGSGKPQVVCNEDVCQIKK